MAIGEWQEGDDPFAISVDAKAAKKESADAALIWAQKYKIFETGAGKDLLNHWTRTMRHKKIAPSAAPTEFAYHAGAREFVESIHLQIEFANNGGQSPYKDR